MFIKNSHKQKLMLIKVDEIMLNPYQMRRKINDTALSKLTESIIHVGLLQPIVVMKQKRNRYQIISGERRLYALKQAGISETYAKVIKVKEKDLALNAFIDNIHVQPYHIIEKAEAVALLVNNFKMTEEEVSNQAGLTRCSIHHLLLISKLHPDIKKQLYHHIDAEQWAIQLIKIKDITNQNNIFKIAIEKKLNTHQFIKLVNQTNKALNNSTEEGPKIIKNVATNQVFINSIEALVKEIKQCGYDTELIQTESLKKTKILITVSKNASKKMIS